MIFNSLPFFVFFATVMAALLAVRNDSARRWILLGASFFFYGYWNAWFLLLMGAVIGWSWCCGIAIENAKTVTGKKLAVTVGTTLSLLALGSFKYAGFFARNLAALAGVPAPVWISHILLPVGISFYTFHSISYYVDVYRGKVRPWRNLRDYALYIAFFPQLVAGPIVRAAQFLPQLEHRITLSWANFVLGGQLFIFGMAQKLLIADTVSSFVDQVFAKPALYSGGTLWLAVFGYAAQIFGDFSGYTLMAIGIARILGFELPRNFRMPYLAVSIVDFWQRWHITLSFFLRDYLYIPLGGNRKGFLRTQLNVATTMLLGGLWHGASWNFVLWGGLHGSGIVVHHGWERFRAGRMPAMPKAVGWAFTLLFVVIAWVPFRATSFDVSLSILHGLLHGRDGIAWYSTPTLIVLACVAIWHVWYLIKRQYEASLAHLTLVPTIETVLILCLLVLFIPVHTSPFIYFQF